MAVQSLCSNCGKELRGKRPVNVVCHDCRRREPRHAVTAELECCICGSEFVRYDAFSAERRGGRTGWKLNLAQPCCSKTCAMKLRAWRERNLSGKPYGGGRKAASRARRAAKAMTWDGVADDEIFERDGWRCQVPECLFRSRVIPRSIKYPDPRSASVDHIVPLSIEPDDTSANKRASHLKCNVARGNRMGAEQLALFGAVEEVLLLTIPGRKRARRQMRGCRRCGAAFAASGTQAYCRDPCRKPVKPEAKGCRSCGVVGEHAPNCLRLMTTDERREVGRKIAALRDQGVEWAAIAPMFGYKSAGAAYNVMAGALAA